MYKNKKILIIGGTGTIGKYLLEELLDYQPEVIRIFSRDEYKQFELQQKLSYQKNIRYLIGDVRDEKRLERAMEDIDYVFHLAAMKHVSACEYNPFEAVKTNIIGTQNVIQAAINTGVRRVLFTSTDKAIAPTNTYGASKLTAERLISAADYQKGPRRTIFSSVRFGNVMGSRGSVIPLFKKQILEEKEITVTNEKMYRYMMTPFQAVSLILKANKLANGGEVFILKMPNIKLNDLVEVITEELTKKYNIKQSINIKKIGLRPGEKMYEQLMTEGEALKVLELDEMYILTPAFGRNEVTISDYIGTNDNNIYNTGLEADKEQLREWLLKEKLI
ncbi:SDR family NAD(P)-dependent oxidoreductase [Gracilibacillus lacisalsi]|uniref:SDR family NAD(P)-dependent oxidoreductase n=1 Tax=Gracilibacillus lacisalsi TaxID=393087 RepID=UPI000380EDEC|nr:SDR family NAD(P)-dependent oxidoreductase [Gracilibacillus lacisalsi]